MYHEVKKWLGAGGEYDQWGQHRLQQRLPDWQLPEQPKPHLFCDADWVAKTLPRSKVKWSGYKDTDIEATVRGGRPDNKGNVVMEDGSTMKLETISAWVDKKKRRAAQEMGHPDDFDQIRLVCIFHQTPLIITQMG
jgi:hypothetical protein